MPTGLQVWDAQGNEIVNATTRLTQFLGYVDIPSEGGSGTITDHRLTQGTPFYMVVTKTTAGWYSGPRVSFNGDKMAYTGSNLIPTGSQAGTVAVRIFYGIY